MAIVGGRISLVGGSYDLLHQRSIVEQNKSDQPNKHNTMEKVSNDVKNHYEQNPHNNDKNIFTKKRQGNNEQSETFPYWNGFESE